MPVKVLRMIAISHRIIFKVTLVVSVGGIILVCVEDLGDHFVFDVSFDLSAGNILVDFLGDFFCNLSLLGRVDEDDGGVLAA